MIIDSSAEEWVSAYLEWIDVQVGEPGVVERRIFVERRRGNRRAGEQDAMQLLTLALRQALEASRALAARPH